MLHPDLRTKCQELIKKCKTRGIDIIISQTLRTKAEQDAIYAQGRTKPGKIVSNVRYPNSMHCWGVAFDVAVIREGKAIWDTSAYKPVGTLGEALGLTWGGRWKNFPDNPHFEMPEYNTSALIRVFGTPAKFIKTWKEEIPVAATSTPSPWAQNAWAWAVKEGIVDGKDPKGPVTREQLAAILQRVLKK